MPNEYLDFISDECFENAITNVMKKYEEALKKRDFGNPDAFGVLRHSENGVDEFKALFDIHGYKMSLEEWKSFEIGRQLDKTINNLFGNFHSELLSCVENWNYLSGEQQFAPILKNEDNSIFIDISNKHNTLSGPKPKYLRTRLESIIREYPEAKAYYGFIVSKGYRSIDEPWKRRDFEDNENICKISGDKIYEIVTGDEQALSKTFKAIRSYLNENYDSNLTEVDNNILDRYENEIF